MPLTPNVTHSLSTEPWLPKAAFVGASLWEVPDPTPDERKKIKNNLMVGAAHWDYDEMLSLSDPDELDDDEEAYMAKRRLYILEQADSALIKSRYELGKSITNHVMSYFRSTRTEERSQQTYEIEIRVRYLKPTIWRLLRVPASMPLHALADRVLLPAMPYARGYHSYVYSLPTAAYKNRMRPQEKHDVCFTLVGAQTIDTMHLKRRRGSYAIVNTEEAILGDVLRVEGDSICWTYDLGDNLDHKIILKKIHPKGSLPDNQAACTALLLDGANCGIPENPGAVIRHAARVEALAKHPPSSSKYRKALKEIQGSATYVLLHQSDPRRFDPTAFCKECTQRAIDEAMAGTPVCYGNTFQGGGGFNLNLMTGEQTGCIYGEPVSALKGNVLCATCKSVLSKPKWCGACLNAAYCNRDCQIRHWKDGHKLSCFKAL